MKPSTTPGLWSASAGAALQLIGLSWDSVQHYLDPGLAERESVFTLANPSHLLISVGLVLTVGGLAWIMVLTGLRRRNAGQRVRRVLAGAGLGVLLAGMGGLAMATGGTASMHEHSHADGAGARGASSNSASGGSGVLASPTFISLQQVLRDQGTEAALTRLEELAARDQNILGVAHDYAHALGRYSLDFYGSAPQAFGRCRETFQSGCYHGVLESYLESNPQLTTQEIAELCDVSITPNAASAVRFQCLHGLGHGLTANAEHDIFQALRLCDALKTDWDRGSCYGGVFMENIIFATHQEGGSSGDEHQHDHGAGHKAHLRAQDPLYPCNVVDDRYKSECFIMQTSAILLYNGYDFQQALVECDRAPGNFIHLCYQSIGRDVSSYTYRDPAKSLDMCLRGQAAYNGYCLLGAAKNMIDVTWKIDEGLELCRAAPNDYKTICYNAIGEQLGHLHPDPTDRARECSRSESDYVPVCARAARATSA